jgi:hypothetical protein
VNINHKDGFQYNMKVEFGIDLKKININPNNIDYEKNLDSNGNGIQS